MEKLIASLDGSKKLRQAREKLGKNVDSLWWLEEASKILNPDRSPNAEYFESGVNEGSWRRFLYRLGSISAHLFCVYCEVLGISVEEVVEMPSSETTYFNLEKREKSNLSITEYLELYCEELIEKFESRWSGRLYIYEKGISRKDIPIYASLYSEYSNCSEKVDLLRALKQESKTVLLGEPGAGKTTSLEKLCLEYSQRYAEEKVLPILVKLSKYTGSLIQLIKASLNDIRETHLGQDALVIEQLLERQSCFILFDGLNEVSSSLRETIIPDMLQFMSLYSRHKYVIASRPQDDLWRMISADEVECKLIIQPIDFEDIAKYLTFHLGEKLGRLAYGEVVGRLRDLLRLPLILSMFKEEILQTKLEFEDDDIELDEVNLKHSRIIPQNRGEMYKKFMSKFLTSERSKVISKLNAKERVKEFVLSELAITMQFQETLGFKLQTVITSFSHSLDKIQASISSGSLLEEIQQSGLLIGEDDISFAHQTFQEFFAATALPRLSTDDVYARINNDWWSETFIFFFGIVGVNDVTQANDLLRAMAATHPMLAVKCLLEGRNSIEGRAILQESLRPMLNSKNWIERRNATEILGVIGNDSVVPLLSERLSDKNGDVRWQAADSLRRISGSEAEIALISALKDTGWATRARAAEALGRMKSTQAIPHLRPLFTSDMPRERGDAVWAIFLMEADEKTIGITELLSDDCDVVSACVELAVKASKEDALIEFLSQQTASNKFYIRASAIHMLTRLRAVQVIPLIKRCLDDSHPDVTIIAMQSLAMLNASEYLPDIFKLLGHSKPFAREIAAHCCQLFGSKAAVPALLPLLQDPDEGVRFAAVKALGTLGVESTVDNCLPLLKDSSTKVRVNAAITLGALGNTSMDIVVHLKEASKDNSFEVQEAAATSIDLIKKRQRFKGFFQP